MNIGLGSEMYNIARNITHIPSEHYMIHSHAFHEIYYFLRGDADYVLGGTEYHLQPHTLLLIPPNTFHGMHVLSKRPYERYTVHFDVSMLSFSRRALLTSILPTGLPGDMTVCHWENMQDSGLHECLQHFEQLHALPFALQKSLTPIYVEALLAQLLVALPAQTAAPRPRTALPQELLSYVNQHFVEPLSLDSLAAQFFVSKSSLNSAFRKHTGTTVMDYVIHKRVTYAQQLLINGVNAAQAAAAAGFGDYTSLYRAYRKYFGRSPNEDKRDVPQHSPFLPDAATLQHSPREAEDGLVHLWERLGTTTVGVYDPATLQEEQ